MRAAMTSVHLGHTGLTVSRLGFGTADFGARSLHIRPQEGARILVESLRLGVNYWDTSDDYGSHPHVALALKRVLRERVVVSTKTSATSGQGARRSLRTSLGELGTDYVDLFLLHSVTADWIEGSREVLRALGELKAAGVVPRPRDRPDVNDAPHAVRL